MQAHGGTSPSGNAVIEALKAKSTSTVDDASFKDTLNFTSHCVKIESLKTAELPGSSSLGQ
jgi:hypothetical protein